MKPTQKSNPFRLVGGVIATTTACGMLAATASCGLLTSAGAKATDLKPIAQGIPKDVTAVAVVGQTATHSFTPLKKSLLLFSSNPKSSQRLTLASDSGQGFHQSHGKIVFADTKKVHVIGEKTQTFTFAENEVAVQKSLITEQGKVVVFSQTGFVDNVYHTRATVFDPETGKTKSSILKSPQNAIVDCGGDGIWLLAGKPSGDKGKESQTVTWHKFDVTKADFTRTIEYPKPHRELHVHASACTGGVMHSILKPGFVPKGSDPDKSKDYFHQMNLREGVSDEQSAPTKITDASGRTFAVEGEFNSLVVRKKRLYWVSQDGKIGSCSLDGTMCRTEGKLPEAGPGSFYKYDSSADKITTIHRESGQYVVQSFDWDTQKLIGSPIRHKDPYSKSTVFHHVQSIT